MLPSANIGMAMLFTVQVFGVLSMTFGFSPGFMTTISVFSPGQLSSRTIGVAPVFHVVLSTDTVTSAASIGSSGVVGPGVGVCPPS